MMMVWAAPQGQASESVSALRLAGQTYVSLSELARMRGYSVSEGADHKDLTVRSERGVLVVFDQSPDILWQPVAESREGEDERSLSAPVTRQVDGWYVPQELLRLLGYAATQDELILPGDRRVAYRFPAQSTLARGAGAYEVVELGNSVRGLTLYASGTVGPETLGLLLVDAGLLPLALPAERHALDEALAQLPPGRPLYFVLTSLAQSPWETSVVFTQGALRHVARYPQQLTLLEGSSSGVSPDAPVSGVMMLPSRFNLRAPVRVSWADVSAEFQFRR